MGLKEGSLAIVTRSNFQENIGKIVTLGKLLTKGTKITLEHHDVILSENFFEVDIPMYAESTGILDGEVKSNYVYIQPVRNLSPIDLDDVEEEDKISEIIEA